MTRALIAGLAVALLLLSAAPASAATPCWLQVHNDWSDNGRIDGRYPDSCYEQALRNLPSDAQIYSDAADVIAAAREQALREKARRPEGRPGVEPGATNSAKGGDANGPIGTALNWGQRAAGDVPLPLFALAGIALLLTAAGGAGLVSRRLHARHAARADDPGDTDS